MITILKYVLILQPEQTFQIRGFMKILSVAEQRAGLVLYCMVNTEADAVHTLDVRIIGTGQDARPVKDMFDFVGTVNTQDGFMWHVFTSLI